MEAKLFRWLVGPMTIFSGLLFGAMFLDGIMSASSWRIMSIVPLALYSVGALFYLGGRIVAGKLG